MTVTYFRIGTSSDIMSDLAILIVVFGVLGIACWVIFFYLKGKDKSKPIQTAKVKILEKPVSQGLVEWYVVEFENGERKKLRNFNVNEVLITTGDVGIIKYSGITIQSFQKEC